MNAVVYRGPRQVAVQSVPDPVSQAPTDAIVRLTTTALCGSDLMIGVWAPHDPHPIDTDDAGSGRFTVPWGTFFQKGISVRFGRTMASAIIARCAISL